MNRCPVCQTKLGREDEFCPKCGAVVKNKVSYTIKNESVKSPTSVKRTSIFMTVVILIVAFVLSGFLLRGMVSYVQIRQQGIPTLSQGEKYIVKLYELYPQYQENIAKMESEYQTIYDLLERHDYAITEGYFDQDLLPRVNGVLISGSKGERTEITIWYDVSIDAYTFQFRGEELGNTYEEIIVPIEKYPEFSEMCQLLDINEAIYEETLNNYVLNQEMNVELIQENGSKDNSYIHFGKPSYDSSSYFMMIDIKHYPNS